MGRPRRTSTEATPTVTLRNVDYRPLVEQLEGAPRAGRFGETPVSREDRRLQTFGQGDIARVVDRQVRPQLPAAIEQRCVRCALDAQGAEIGECETCTPFIEVAARYQPSPGGHHLEIDQLWRREPLPPQSPPSAVAIVAVVGERRDDDRGIDDDQRASRSARTALAAMSSGARPPARPPARSSTSSSVGTRASAAKRASTYSCRDWPAEAARRRNVAWTSSGTCFTWIVGMAVSVAP